MLGCYLNLPSHLDFHNFEQISCLIAFAPHFQVLSKKPWQLSHSNGLRSSQPLFYSTPSLFCLLIIIFRSRLPVHIVLDLQPILRLIIACFRDQPSDYRGKLYSWPFPATTSIRNEGGLRTFKASHLTFFTSLSHFHRAQGKEKSYYQPTFASNDLAST